IDTNVALGLAKQFIKRTMLTGSRSNTSSWREVNFGAVDTLANKGVLLPNGHSQW
ncbi:hypothetical protein IFM89_014888, partial [Coptis chinensis]